MSFDCAQVNDNSHIGKVFCDLIGAFSEARFDCWVVKAVVERV